MTQNCQLIVFVSDSEAELQTDLLTELTQQLGAKSVDRSALDALDASAQLALEAFGNLARRFVGKGEYTNPAGIEAKRVDKEADALDQAESFAGARSGQNEKGLGGRFDGSALGCGWNTRNGCGIGDGRRRVSDDRCLRRRGSVRARTADRQVRCGL